MVTLMLDLRHGFRSLLRKPGFTIAAGLTLALGIGANIASFSLLNRLVLGVVPFQDADRLVVVYEEMPEQGHLFSDLSVPNFLDFKENATSFESMAVWRNRRVNLSGYGEPLSVELSRVSSSFFPTLGVQPALGRGFHAEEDRFEGPRVVVLGYGLWQTRFAGDDSVLGQTIRIDGTPHQIVGVMGAEFALPSTMFDSDADLYVPMAFTPDELRSRGWHGLWSIARLKPGVTVAAADEEIKEIARELARKYPDENANRTGAVYSLQEGANRFTRIPALVLMGVVALVLLVACSNVANLLLARGLARRRELAIRSVMGAGTRRLFAQMATESLLLGLLGGLGGLLVAWLVLSSFPTLLPFVPELSAVALDGGLLLFAALVSLAATVVFGLLPAWQVTRLSPNEVLNEGARSSGGQTQHRTRSALVVLQVALATTLLVAAGLLLRTLGELYQIDPGFDPQHLLTTSCVRPAEKYPDFESMRALYEQLDKRVSAIQGVQAAALTDTLPLGSFRMHNTYSVEGQPQPPGHWLLAFERSVTSGFFVAMGIPIMEGRALTEADTDQDVVVINQYLAEKHWPGESAIGKRISLSGPRRWRVVVGVAGNISQDTLIEPARGATYKPLAQEDRSRYVSFALRVSGDPSQYVAALKAAVNEVDPDLAFYETRTGRELLGRQLRIAGAVIALIAGFSLLALLLAAVGLNGVVSLLVGLRTREIGIRMALGAHLQGVLMMVLGEGLRRVLTGVALGLVAAFGLGRAISSLLYGVAPTDLVTFVLVPVVVGVVAVVSCIVPAMRAASVHPTVALRDE
jgi:putative ABC transport system permease protein